MLMNAPAVPLKSFVLVSLADLLNTGVLAIGIGPLAGKSAPPRLASTTTDRDLVRA